MLRGRPGYAPGDGVTWWRPDPSARWMTRVDLLEERLLTQLEAWVMRREGRAKLWQRKINARRFPPHEVHLMRETSSLDVFTVCCGRRWRSLPRTDRVTLKGEVVRCWTFTNLRRQIL